MVSNTKILPPAPSGRPSKKARRSLRAKLIWSAIALGIIPIATISAVAYKITASHITRQIEQTQQDRTHHLAHMFEQFIITHVQEAETLAVSPIFTNPNITETVTLNQNKAGLNSFVDRTGFYDNIVYLDLEGNPVFQSQSENPLRSNYSDRAYFRKAIEQKRTTLNEIGISTITGQPRVEFAVPVKNAWTDEVIGVLRFRIRGELIVSLLADYTNSDEQWHLISTQGTFLASTVDNLIDRPLENYFPLLQQAHASQQTITTRSDSPIDEDSEQIINYVPIELGVVNPNLNLGTAMALNTDLAFAPLQSLRWIYLGGTIGTALLVGLIAGFWVNKIERQLLKLMVAVDELGQGKLDTKVEANGEDELALLGERINNMAEQLDRLMERQKTIARTSELIAKVSQALTARELQLPLSLLLAEVRNIIKSDRLFFYRFDKNWKGTIIAESIASNFPRTLGAQFDDPCFTQEYVRKYQRGRIQAISDIYQAGLTQCYIDQLEPYEVKASLVLPVIIEKPATPESEKLIGLLIAHQCSQPRGWSQSDIDYLQQTSYQLATILRGYVVHEEENWRKADINKEVSEVLSRIKSISKGDLRINDNKSRLTNDVTKSIDSTVNNLRQAARQIKNPCEQINNKLAVGKDDLADLNDRLKQQANQLARIFAFIEQMSSYINKASSQAETASQTVNSVVVDLESEKANFNHAIAFMSRLQTSLHYNTERVKNLSSASQKMTRAIGSIRKINLRASLLASKLSKRIPELDESAFGLKEEIKSIQQSIAATKELEEVVRNIESEISQVLRNYQADENQLEQENYLVANASKNLEHIVKITKNAQQQLFSLANVTNLQSQTDQKITSLKDESEVTSTSLAILSDRAIDTIEETIITAKDLENAVNFFKLTQTSNL